MTTRDATIIVYPETDGLPLPDGDFQAPLYVRIVSTLRIHFADVRGARVNGDTFIYYVEGNRRRSVSPDCYVALDLSDEALASIERNNAYMLWEVGKSPDFVLEIGSESTAEADLGREARPVRRDRSVRILAIRRDRRRLLRRASGWREAGRWSVPAFRAAA